LNPGLTILVIALFALLLQVYLAAGEQND